MTHVAIYTDDPGEGGVAVYCHSLACGLKARGYQVTVAQSKVDSPWVQQQQRLGIAHSWLPFATRDVGDRGTSDLDVPEKFFAEAQPGIVVFANCSPVSHIAAKSVAARRKLPFVIVEGFVAPYPQPTPEDAQLLAAAAEHYRQASAVVAVSQENLQLLARDYGLPQGKGQVIYYGRPDEYFAPPQPEVRARLREEFAIPADALLVLTVGRLEQVKGYSHLVDALKVLRPSPTWPRLYFAWIGAGSQAGALQAAIDELGVADHVRMLGQRYDVPQWLDASDVFLLPSYYEGMPLSIMEAMAKGLPVAASAVSGVPEQLGNTGQLLPSPVVDPAATTQAIAATVEAWAADEPLRRTIGQQCRERAAQLFREPRMIHQTVQVIERALLPAGDYISPGLDVIRPDHCFPFMEAGDKSKCRWKFLRREIPHNWYVDSRLPEVGFVNRDEASLLFNIAHRFRGQRALQIGCWLGWSACHLALGGVLVDVIDPVLEREDFAANVVQSLKAAGVYERVQLVPGYSPHKIEQLAIVLSRRWPLFYIDGNHDSPNPLLDAQACAENALPDAMMVFHDLASPHVAEAVEYLRQQGWQVLIYMTMQIMAVCWRGNVRPPQHVPDPSIDWPIPAHLRHFTISGLNA